MFGADAKIEIFRLTPVKQWEMENQLIEHRLS